jgi:membrane-associated phospholipid phosphatase
MTMEEAAMSTLPRRASGPLDPDRHAAAAASTGRRPAAASLTYLLSWALVILAVLLGSGLLLVKYATGNDVGEADAWVARWFVSERTPTLDDATKWASLMADTFVVIVAALFVVVSARLVLKRWREAMLVVAALVTEVVLFLITTALIDRERPDVSHLDDAPPTSSFPSGHVAAAVCLYGALALIAWTRMRPGALRGVLLTVLAIIPLLVAAARMYRGMHYLSDVIGGLVLGVACLTVAGGAVRRGVMARTSGGARTRTSPGRR